MGSEYRHIFTPITIRGVEYKNRIEMAHVVGWVILFPTEMSSIIGYGLDCSSLCQPHVD